MTRDSPAQICNLRYVVLVPELDQEPAGDALPAWPGPLTANSTWRDVEARLDHHIAERKTRNQRRQQPPSKGDSR